MRWDNLLNYLGFLIQKKKPAEGFPRVLALISLIFLPLSALGIDPKTVPSVSNELKALSTKIQELNKRKLEQEGEVGALQLQLRDMEKRIAQNQKKLKSLKREIKQSKGNVVRLNKEVDAQQSKQAVASEELAQMLKQQFKTGFVKPNQQLLQPSAAEKYLLNLKLLDYARSAQAEQVRMSGRMLESLKSLEEKAHSELAKLERLEAKSAQTQRDLKQTKNDRSRTISKLDKSLHSSQKELENLDANRRQLTELLERLRFAANNPELLAQGETDFASLRGKLNWPVNGKVIKTSQAPGVTIYAPEGRKVRAISQGRVVFSDWMRGFGLLVIIDHGNGYMSLYGHNQSLFKQLGDWVEAGAAIATIGASGGHAEAGLYFEIRQEAKPLDPRSWCS